MLGYNHLLLVKAKTCILIVNWRNALTPPSWQGPGSRADETVLNTAARIVTTLIKQGI